MRVGVLGFVMTALVGGALSFSCTVQDTTTGQAVCLGKTYDFSQIQTTSGSKYGGGAKNG